MSKRKVAVLGAKGMLGRMVYKILSNDKNIEAVPFSRDQEEHAYVNALLDGAYELKGLSAFDWVINCIGVIKPYIKNNVEEAIRVNSLFPHELAKIPNIKIIQIATDCWEDQDVYGRSKALGEVSSPNFTNIRCSIIGPGNKDSLFDWFLSQKGSVKGYTSHFWNGVTTLAFAKLCRGIVLENAEDNRYNGINFIPADYVSKYELLALIKRIYVLPVSLKVKSSPEVVYKVLPWLPYGDQKEIWGLAGYEEVPTIENLLFEMRGYCGE